MCHHRVEYLFVSTYYKSFLLANRRTYNDFFASQPMSHFKKSLPLGEHTWSEDNITEVKIGHKVSTTYFILIVFCFYISILTAYHYLKCIPQNLPKAWTMYNYLEKRLTGFKRHYESMTIDNSRVRKTHDT
jgi:hypothetical protein